MILARLHLQRDLPHTLNLALIPLVMKFGGSTIKHDTEAQYAGIFKCLDFILPLYSILLRSIISVLTSVHTNFPLRYILPKLCTRLYTHTMN